jgi:ClpP class serine protease
MAWLLKPEIAQAMRAARTLGYQPTTEERAKFAAQMQEAYAARDGDVPRIMNIAGDTAEVSVEGVLTEKPDCFALMFGGGNTTYEGIRQSLARAESDPSIKKVVMNVASPGGSVRGLFETLGAIEAFSKPITVRASLAASAAYGIAAVAGPIEATTAASEFGSVGVACEIYLDDEVVQITSTEAPNKRPDVRTEEGQGVVRGYLDAFHEIFVDAIARGRSASTGEKITAADVNAGFGRGASVLAKQSKAAGMIDRIAPQPKRTRPGARAETEDHDAPPATSPQASAAAEESTGEKITAADVNAGFGRGASVLAKQSKAAGMIDRIAPQPKRTRPGARAETEDHDAPPATSPQASAAAEESKPMKLDELKAQHPELYAAVLAEGNAAGVAAGTAAERKRVNAHLTLGKKCGAMDFAVKCIGEGKSTLDEEVHAEYMGTAMNRRDQETKQQESDGAGAVTRSAKAPAAPAASGDLVDLFAADLPEKKKVG